MASPKLKPTHVALLRGINVGGNNKVPMKELARCFAGMGFAEVQTYINSGNVLFATTESSVEVLCTSVEKTLKKQFGFDIRVLVKTKKDMERITKAIPAFWKNDAAMKADVIFLWKEVDSKRSLKEIAQTPQVDTLIYTKGAIIWGLDKAHYTKSKMHDFIGTHIYKHMTARNVNTVRKLWSLFG